MSKTPVTTRIGVVRGDGVGPEIIAAAERVFDALAVTLDITELPLTGAMLSEAGIDTLQDIGVLLKGPTHSDESGVTMSYALRDRFKLFANIRPALNLLPESRFGPIDLLLIRENLEGLYVGVEHYIPLGDDPRAVAESSGIITREGCNRVADFAFRYAIENERKTVTVVHKANILKALTGLFLETVRDAGERYAGSIAIEDRIVDACAMQLILNPAQFDVLLTTNMFGDILSDEITGLVGGPTMSASASFGATLAVFEPVHPPCAELAGQDQANPTGALLAAAMLLDHIGRRDAGERLRNALRRVYADRTLRTAELGGSTTTTAFTDAVIAAIAA